MGFITDIFSPKPAKSGNLAYGQLNSTYGPSTKAGTGATNFLSDLLGVSGGDPEAGWAGYKEKAGFAPALEAMQRGVVGGAASRGLLNSGSTSRRLLQEGAKIDQGFYNNYLSQLAGLSGIGLESGNLIAKAGQQSTGEQESTASGIGKGIKTVASIASIFSDPRLKTDIEKIGERSDGLGLYSFRYKGTDQWAVGVMADEVALLRPDALGPTFAGYATVNYGALAA